MSIFIYYVYAYLREDGTPYYIGKGIKNRAFENHKHIPVPTNKSRIIFLEKNLSDIGALALERRYIRWYGRKNNKSGILRNLTDGGEGVYGYKHSEKTKKYLSDLARSENLSKETKRKRSASLKGKVVSEQTRQKIRNSNIGKKLSSETKRKLSIALKGKPQKKRKLDAPFGLEPKLTESKAAVLPLHHRAI